MRNQSRNVAAVSFALVLVIVAAPASTPPMQKPERMATVNSPQSDLANLTELQPGRPIQGELKGGETHSYRVRLEAGQYMQVVVEQKGIDVIVALADADGKPVVEMRTPKGDRRPERVLVIAETSGSYRVDVRSDDNQDQACPYEVKEAELRRASPQDRERLSAQAVFVEALRVHALGTKEGLTDAIKRYRSAVATYRSAGDRAGEALVLAYMGDAYSALGEAEKALEYYGQALPLDRMLGNQFEEGRTLASIGEAQYGIGETQKALTSFNEALPPEEAVGDQAGEATTLNKIGEVYESFGEWRKALHYLDRALAMRRAVADRDGEAETLNNIGAAYDGLGEMQKALDYYSQVLPLVRTVGDRAGEAATLSNIGLVYAKLGEGKRALDYYGNALLLERVVGNRDGECATLDGIGVVYSNLGEGKKALDYYGQALLLERALGDRYREGATLNNVGLEYANLGERKKALDYYSQALLLRRAVGDRDGEGVTLNNIGASYDALGERQKALDYYNLALPVTRAVGNRAQEVATLFLKARLERNGEDLAAARRDSEAALNIVETLRAGVASQELRTSYFSTVQKYYKIYIDILMHLQFQHPGSGVDRLAFEASERCRARSLLDALAEAHADIRQGVDRNLLNRAGELQELLEAKSEARLRLLGASHPNGEALAASKKEIDALLAQYQDLEAQIRTTSPRYAALTQPHPLSTNEIQQLLDPDTLLLEYALGGERSYLWAVTPDSLTSYTLPRRDEIEHVAHHLYDLLTTSERNRRRKESERQRQGEVEQPDRDFRSAAAKLSQMILGPAAAQLGAKRLVIVADGVLQYIPIGALPALVVAGEAQKAKFMAGMNDMPLRPLIVDHEIINLPSASVLAELRQEPPGRGKATRLVAVLADPVFDAEDGRVRRTARGGPANVGATEKQGLGNENKEEIEPLSASLEKDRLNRSATEAGLAKGGELHFPRLVFTRQEANFIIKQAPPGHAMEALDFRASRETATDPEFAEYQIIHFATHGLVDSEHPELSGLVLSMVDEEGRPKNGFLDLEDIFNLKLGAKLVVLSACETALGKEVKGEGLEALTRGFMYTGAQQVVASLWQVDDVATAELMKGFYRGVLKDGLKPAAALRKAQVNMWKQKHFTRPYYWAGFVLQGDWK